ncbi:MAG: class I SAM-dependent methyltransferase [Candidatus Thorarchaeota archaeon]|jgi:predicted O-methyltransferase YrrM
MALKQGRCLMAYHGYTNLMCQFLDALPNHHVRILEIGIDKGQMMIPLVHHLIKTHRPFEFVGIDILVKDHLDVILRGFNLDERRAKVSLINGNSLEEISKISGTFDLILVDGDHNYYTVKNEMTHIERLSRPHTIVLCDDYHGKWGQKDLYYSEREGYAEIKIATERKETEKQGVAPAIDEWLEEHVNWTSISPLGGEPILLKKSDTGLLRGIEK